MAMGCPDDRSIDLHAHTTASDGDQSPTDLVRRAKEAGLRAVAVTDHDTIEGVAEALEAGARYGIEVVPGVELSAQSTQGQCHLLGYLYDPAAPGLASRLRQMQENRTRRNALMLEKLHSLNIDITLDDVKAEAGGDILARPHFAKALVKKGVVSTVQEAFDKYLADGAAGHIHKDKLTAEESIQLVHEAGGVVLLAHPNNLKRDEAGTEAEILRLKDLGLDGIEARYSLHTPEDTARYLALAQRLGLLTSGGSDFHGPTVKPNVFLGHVEGDCPAPYSLLDALREAQRRYP